jgi:hypothetical protein
MMHWLFTMNYLFSFSEVDEYVIKAQIHAGGRGLGHFDNGFKSGVHLTKEYVLSHILCGVTVWCWNYVRFEVFTVVTMKNGAS